MDHKAIALYCVGVIVSAAVLHWGPRRLGTILIGLAAIALVPGWIAMSALCPGGSALQGGVDEDGYFMGRHGAKLSQVERSTYCVCLGAEATGLFSHSVLIGAFLAGWIGRKTNSVGRLVAQARRFLCSTWRFREGASEPERRKHDVNPRP
jgi:hypothetical protein